MSHCFISYSNGDADDFGPQLAMELEGGHQFVEAWFDKRDIKPGQTWDERVPEAIKTCKCLLFVMTKDSVAENSICFDEWDLALKYKKPILVLRLHKDAEPPFRLGKRQWIDFTDNHKAGMAKLFLAIQRLDKPEGQLDILKDRLADAERDLVRATQEDKLRIQAEIEQLKNDIQVLEKIIDNPEAAAKQTQINIETGLERERKPEKESKAKDTSTKFINPPPGIAPTYFQDRQIENKQVVDFLNDDAQRLMTIVGRGGVGKTAMVCRLLKGLEGGELPDGLGKMRVEGIVYLSESGSHRVNFANLFYDLCKLLPSDAAQELDAVYKNPQGSTESKMRALLEKFGGGRVVVLLDNFEPLVDTETFAIRDAELDEALRAFLNGTHTAVKVVITTRVAPRALNLIQPGRQRGLTLDEGLESPYAENILREMDSDGRLGLKSARAEALNRARIKTRGFPRALEALFAILASDRYTTLEELLAMPLPENVVEALVGEAFNRLDTNAQKVMQALAVYNRPVTPAAVDYLLAPHLPAMDSAPILQRLVSMHFVRRYVGGKYLLHPTDREFSFDLIPLGSQTDWLTTGNQSQNNLMTYFFGKLLKAKPELIEKIKQGDQQAINAGFAELIKELEPSDRELFDEVRKGVLALDPTIVEKTKDPTAAQDKEFMSTVQDSLKQIKVSAKWSQYALLFRAADYFAQARKPREEWKKLDDLSAQLAEFDLRCAAGDYDTAASLLLEIDFDYLLLWGHYRSTFRLYKKVYKKIEDKVLHRNITGNMGTTCYYMAQYQDALLYHGAALKMAEEEGSKSNQAIWINWIANSSSDLGQIQIAIEQYEKSLNLAKEIGDRESEAIALGNLGLAYANLGNVRKAIEFHEQALIIAREIGDHKSESAQLGNIGLTYADLGNVRKAIEFHEQALIISREIGNRRGESSDLGNLGNCYAELGEELEAIDYFEQAAAISREIGDRRGEAIDLENISHAYLGFEDYQKAKDNYQQAIQIADETSLISVQLNARYGLAQAYLFQNELINARAAIEAALGYDVPNNNHNASALHGIIALRQGDEVTARGAFVRAIGQADEVLSKTAEYYSALDAKGLALCGLAILGDPSGFKNPKGLAIETFRAARKIAPHAGIVKSVLRLFDELAKCDKEGILKDVRKVISASLVE